MTLPEAFLAYTRELMGEKLFATFMKGIEEETPTSIRINPFKITWNGEHGTSNVPWCKNGFYLEERPNFTFDPLLHAGAYYVQEAASMFLDLVLRTHVKQPVTMLDACAAPGGKTTCAMSALPEGSVLFSNEPMHTRANILAENILKYGNPNNYFKIDFFISQTENVFSKYSSMFTFDLLGQPGVTNSSVVTSVEQCLVDKDLQNQIKHSPFYSIYVKSNKY